MSAFCLTVKGKKKKKNIEGGRPKKERSSLSATHAAPAAKELTLLL